MSAPDKDPVPYYPPGPALLYVHAEERLFLGPDRRTLTVTRVDHGLPGADCEAVVQRERRILRALLEHALWLLDREEGPT